ncbi:hypothetical protein PVL29_016219 [Vitis rotundifolia]|uniref:NB-ARC domain-containing protein n=1 Tax=Vitis rotundifolia TaxID=103349 RepID=A0AA38ZEP6_VITRO|nr:hypothetical protein PVL29_016219 [Vitis rotundifolia]
MANVVTGAADTIAVEVYKDGRSLLTSANSKIAFLIQEARKLWELKDATKTEISRHKISPVTREWIVKVEMIRREVRELETKYNDERKHPWRLKRKQVQGLLEEGNLKREVLVTKLIEPVRKIHAPKLEHNSSLHQVLEDVVSFLDNKQIRKIGIWETMGTGKITIMQNLNNQKDITKMFDIVIWVTVSKEWSLKKLQGAIMQRLKLNMQNNIGIEENTCRISIELKGKKYLIILDKFMTLLIYMNKVVLVSRLCDICKDMEADELINVKPLSDHEAFSMFKGKVGQSIHFPGIKPNRVARTFRKKEKHVSLWRDGLNNLFCYDNLDSNAKKVCFLYGVIYPEKCEIYIDYLLECWRANVFIPDADEFVYGKNQFGDARDKGHVILDDLINVSLLKSSEKKKCVKKNKVLGDMTLKISMQIGDSKLLAKPCEGLEEPPNHEEWKQASRISLMDDELCSLPETLNCSDLLTLFIQRNKNLILDFHGTSIESLPSSLSSLICLRGLYLNSCVHLVELLTEIEALVQLEVLDIRETKISLLQIRILVWLKCLRISLSNFGMGSLRDGNGAGSGRVAPIPTPSRLIKIIPIPVPFKKLNGVGWGGTGIINPHTRPALSRLIFF